MTSYMRNGFFKKFFLIIFGLILALVIAEFALRAINLNWPDVYTKDADNGLLLLKPDQEMVVRTECFNNIVKTNSQGFHSKEYSIHKPQGAYRIAVTGDSFTEAKQVSLEKTFFYLLEEKLNSLPDKQFNYQVIPFGVSSHGTHGNLLYLKEYALDFKPDLVIDAFLVSNDIRDDLGDVKNINKIMLDPPGPVKTNFKSKLKKHIRNSALVMNVYNKYLTLKANQQVQDSKSISDDKDVFLVNYQDNFKKGWEIQNKLLSKFNLIAQENGAKFLLISLTEGFRVHDQLFEELDSKYHNQQVYNFNKPEQLLKQIARANNFKYFPLLAYFKNKAENSNELTVWFCDGHWNETGHAWAAEALFDYLSANQQFIGMTTTSLEITD